MPHQSYDTTPPKRMMTVPCELWPIVFYLATSNKWPPRDEANVIAFFDFAHRESLLALLMSDENVPATVAAAKQRYRVLDALYRRRYELSRDRVFELQRVIGREAFLLLKGMDYQHRLYARPGLRPMADIDILVQSTKMNSILKRLTSEGYSLKYGGHGAFYAPNRHEVAVVIGNVCIDVHRRFAQPFRTGIDYDAMLQRKESFEREGIFGYRLAPVDAILSHAYSGLAMDEFTPPLIRYVDFYLLLQRYEDELGECVSRAKAWGIERALFSALHITSTLFPSAQTTAVNNAINQLLDARTKRFLVKRVLPNPAKERSGNISGRYMQLWRKFSLMDRTWRRLAFVAYYAYETAIGFIFEWHANKKGIIPARRSENSSR